MDKKESTASRVMIAIFMICFIIGFLYLIISAWMMSFRMSEWMMGLESVFIVGSFIIAGGILFKVLDK